jgi:uncharacterized protein YwgA
MTRRDWLLLYFALKGGSSGLDPVRIQKGMFLFAQEANVPENERYTFRAYSYGPMSPQVYADIDALAAEGLIRGEPVPGYTWKQYKITATGRDTARSLLDDIDKAAARKLFEIKQEVVSRTFNQLLRYVYERYPAYATKSVFSG